jgi:uncharacterized protein
MKTKRGEVPWAEVGGRVQTPWRKELHQDFERALAEIKLPERPDYEAANCFLVKARREMATSRS